MNLDNRLGFLPLICIGSMIFFLLKYLLSYHSVTIATALIIAILGPLNEIYSSCNQPDDLRCIPNPLYRVI